MPKIFSFFSGSGFLDLGFEQNGFEIGLVNEFQPEFLRAYRYARQNMGIQVPDDICFNTDVNDFLSGDLKEDLLCRMAEARVNGHMVGFIGGPPCPDFSIAGKNKGKEGENGKLSLSYIRLIIDMQPDFFLFENVKGLWRTAKHRAFFEELKAKLHRAGYATTERLTNSLEYGAPQDRDRIFLFGVRKVLLGNHRKGNLIVDFPWTRYQTYTMEDIKSYQWPNTDTFMVDVETQPPQGIPLEMTVEHWFRENDVNNHPNANNYFIPRQGLARMQTIEEGDVSRKSYKRLHRWRYSPTVAYGNNEVHLHPYRERRLSAAEALSLQTLPADFVLPPDMTLTDMFKTIGNGVPYILSSGIARTIFDYLEMIQ